MITNKNQEEIVIEKYSTYLCLLLLLLLLTSCTVVEGGNNGLITYDNIVIFPEPNSIVEVKIDIGEAPPHIQR